jgi:hypothetical protein
VALTVLNGPVIEAGSSLSAGLDCSAGTIVRLTMPAASIWTPANISFAISSDGNGFNDLFTLDGHEIVIPCNPGTAVVFPIDNYMRAIAFLQIRSGSRAFPKTQANRVEFAVAIETEAVEAYRLVPRH